MDGRAGDREPYGAVLVLTAWAARNWLLLDGQLQQVAIDLEERAAGPANRFFALLRARFHAVVTDALMWAKEGKERDGLKAALAVLEWPDVAEANDAEEQDREARAAMAAAGISVDIDAALAARVEMLARQAANGNNDPVPSPEPTA